MKKLIITIIMVLCFLGFLYANPMVKKRVKVEENIKAQESFVEKNTEHQIQMRRGYTSNLRDYKRHKTTKALFLALLFAFLYGIVHCLGPGHGKVFLMGQVIASNIKFLSILWSSTVFAFIHSLSGLLLVGILSILNRSILRGSNDWFMLAQNISFLLIIFIGLYIAIKTANSDEYTLLKQQSHCGHNKRGLLLTTITIGLVPCPGAILVAVYAMKIDMFSTGFLMILSMAVGMALTLTIVNSIVLFTKAITVKTILNRGNFYVVSKVMAMLGAILLISLGVYFFSFNMSM